MMWWFYAILLLCTLLWLYFKQVYSFWANLGVPTPKFRYLFGNVGESLIFKKNPGQIIANVYKEYEGYNYVGIYNCMQPAIVVRSPELLKEIYTTSFKNFKDNDIHVDEKNDLIFGKNPFSQKGDKWKTVRNQISPIFTMNRLKSVIPLLQQNAKNMVAYLDKNAKGVPLEAKELAQKFTCDNVVSCAFGLDGGCFTSERSVIRENGHKIVEPSLATGIRMLVAMMFPAFSNVMKIKFVPDEVTNFFRDLVEETVKYRETNNVVRGDFLDYMIDIRKKINNEKEFNIDDIVAHAGGFFIDGYESSAIAISFALYEIATNEDAQNKLRDEIRDVIEKHGGELTYDSVNEMEYLECIMKESLRLHPPALSIAKNCTEPYKLPPVCEDGTGATPTLQVGDVVIIPIYGIHRDEKYYPEPDKFKPERFDENNKQNLVKSTYLAFGEGPRMCVGNKFGLLQSKLGIAAIISKYKITVHSKTQQPLEIDPQYFFLGAIGGLWLNFEKI